MRGKPKEGSDIDLGLAISGATLAPGETRTDEEMAFYCGCTRQCITNIAKTGLQKLRKAFTKRNDPVLKELLESYPYIFQPEPDRYRVQNNEIRHAYDL